MKVDCSKCVNSCPVCRSCVHFITNSDHYNEGPIGDVSHNNCDGCAVGARVVNGLHIMPGGGSIACTADRYTKEQGK